MDFEDMLIWRLLIAVPEFEFDQLFAKILADRGYIRQDALYLGAKIRGRINSGTALGRKMRGKNLIQRIVTVMPEILSVKVVNWLSDNGLIGITLAHNLRIALRAKDAILPIFVEGATAAGRAMAVFDAIFSPETIDIIRAIDAARISAMKLQIDEIEAREVSRLEEAMNSFLAKESARLKRFNFDNVLSPADRDYLKRVKIMRSSEIWLIKEMAKHKLEDAMLLSASRAQWAKTAISLERLVRQTVTEVLASGKTWDVITTILNSILSDDMLKNAIRIGVIDAKHYNMIRSIERYGFDIWKKVGKAFEYESWAARALMITEGVVSHELLEALYANKLISKELRDLMNPGINILRAMTREIGNQYRTSTRIRVVPGQNPLSTFVRRTEASDRAILKLLKEAAEDSRKFALTLELKKGIGASARAAQQRLIQNEMYQSIRRLYENVGFITIHGEKQAANAAAEAMDLLTNKVWGNTKALQDIKRAVQRSSRSGIDSYISRQENLVDLSSRLYRGGLHGRSVVDREINKALLRGLSPAEFAKNLESVFKPNVPGGVSFNAMRLARTEMNNAFHMSQIRYSREMPWVTGYKWNRSGRASSKPHACSDYANNDSYGMGRGVFPKRDVPSKPHPLCLCYITTVTMSNGLFEKRLRSGAFNQYLQSVEDAGFFEDDWKVDRRNAFAEYFPAFADTAKTVAIGQVASLVKAAMGLK